MLRFVQIVLSGPTGEGTASGPPECANPDRLYWPRAPVQGAMFLPSNQSQLAGALAILSYHQNAYWLLGTSVLPTQTIDTLLSQFLIYRRTISASVL